MQESIATGLLAQRAHFRRGQKDRGLDAYSNTARLLEKLRQDLDAGLNVSTQEVVWHLANYSLGEKIPEGNLSSFPRSLVEGGGTAA